MNVRQTAFVQEYLIDLNGKQAAIRAGYAPKNAEVTASKLLRTAKVKAEVAKVSAKHAEKCEITRETIAKEYEKDRAAARLLDNPQLSVAVTATEKIAKMYGLDGTTKLEHSGAIINIESKDADCA